MKTHHSDTLVHLALIMSISIFSKFAFAHGENIPGPHGGYIRMPGAFHTELLPEKDGYRVFLLDINWKNPSVMDSSVSAVLVINSKKTELICNKESDSFFCKPKSTTAGILEITAKREGQNGGISSYQLPLKFESPDSKHSQH